MLKQSNYRSCLAGESQLQLSRTSNYLEGADITVAKLFFTTVLIASIFFILLTTGALEADDITIGQAIFRSIMGYIVASCAGHQLKIMEWEV